MNQEDRLKHFEPLVKSIQEGEEAFKTYCKEHLSFKDLVTAISEAPIGEKQVEIIRLEVLNKLQEDRQNSDKNLDSKVVADALLVLKQEHVFSLVMQFEKKELSLAALTDLHQEDFLVRVVLEHRESLMVRLALHKISRLTRLESLLKTLESSKDLEHQALSHRVQERLTEVQTLSDLDETYLQKRTSLLEKIDGLTEPSDIRSKLFEAHHALQKHLRPHDQEGIATMKSSVFAAESRLKRAEAGELLVQEKRMLQAIETLESKRLDSEGNKTQAPIKEQKVQKVEQELKIESFETTHGDADKEALLLQGEIDALMAQGDFSGDFSLWPARLSGYRLRLDGVMKQASYFSGSARESFQESALRLESLISFVEHLMGLEKIETLPSLLLLISDAPRESSLADIFSALSLHQLFQNLLKSYASNYQGDFKKAIPLILKVESSYAIYQKEAPIVEERRARLCAYLSSRLNEVESRLGGVDVFRMPKQLSKIKGKFDILFPEEKEPLLKKVEALGLLVEEKKLLHLEMIYPKQEALCIEGEALLGRKDLDCTQALKELRSLQERWKELAKGIEHQQYWRRFSEVAQKIYKSIMEREETTLSQNKEKREKLSIEAERMASSNLENLPWRDLALFCASQWKGWREAKPYSPENEAERYERFSKNMRLIQKRLDEHYSKMLALKTELCQKVEELSEQKTGEEQKLTKLLQKEWKSIGHTGIHETELWERFSKACSKIFSDYKVKSKLSEKDKEILAQADTILSHYNQAIELKEEKKMDEQENLYQALPLKEVSLELGATLLRRFESLQYKRKRQGKRSVQPSLGVENPKHKVSFSKQYSNALSGLQALWRLEVDGKREEAAKVLQTENSKIPPFLTPLLKKRYEEGSSSVDVLLLRELCVESELLSGIQVEPGDNLLKRELQLQMLSKNQGRRSLEQKKEYLLQKSAPFWSSYAFDMVSTSLFGRLYKSMEALWSQSA